MSKVTITLKKSKIGATKNQKLILESLGLGKIGSSVTHNNVPHIYGMIDKVKHLILIEEI